MKELWRLQIPALRRAQGLGRFAEFTRKPKSHFSVAGYLLELARDCLVIREFHWDTFAWNGTCIIRTQDVAGVKIFEETDWPIIANKHLKLVAKTGMKVTTDTFRTVAERYVQEGDLVQIEQEKTHPGDLFLCEVLRLGRSAIRTKSYDRSLQSCEEVTMPYQEITKVTFGDGYSNAAKIALRKGMMTNGVPHKR